MLYAAFDQSQPRSPNKSLLKLRRYLIFLPTSILETSLKRSAAKMKGSKSRRREVWAGLWGVRGDAENVMV